MNPTIIFQKKKNTTLSVLFKCKKLTPFSVDIVMNDVDSTRGKIGWWKKKQIGKINHPS
jgi:hypothetical protein